MFCDQSDVYGNVSCLANITNSSRLDNFKIVMNSNLFNKSSVVANISSLAVIMNSTFVTNSDFVLNWNHHITGNTICYQGGIVNIINGTLTETHFANISMRIIGKQESSVT